MVRRYVVTVAGQRREVTLEEAPAGQADEVRATVDGRARTLRLARGAAGVMTWWEGTRLVRARVDGALPKLMVSFRGTAVPVEVVDARRQAIAEVTRDRLRVSGPVSVRAPIPGRVAKVLVKVGERVGAGARLAVVEAMKMENEIRAPRDGTVAQVSVAEGQTVEAHQELVSLA